MFVNSTILCFLSLICWSTPLTPDSNSKSNSLAGTWCTEVELFAIPKGVCDVWTAEFKLDLSEPSPVTTSFPLSDKFSVWSFGGM